MVRSEGAHLPERHRDDGPRGGSQRSPPSTLLAPWSARERRFGSPAPAPRRRHSRRSRTLLFAAASLLVLAGAVVGRSTLAPSLTGSFELPADSLSPGMAGGSQLSVGSGGQTADLTLWSAAGAPTYFFPALVFVVQASSPPQGGSVRGTIAVALDPGSGSLRAGEELYALVGPYEGLSSTTLGGGPLVPGGALRAPSADTNSLSPLGVISYGMDLGPGGVAWVGSTSSVAFSLPSGGEASLALEVGVLLGGGEARPSQVSFTLTVMLSSPPV
ncbi:MAG: hypothetical protein KGJ23_09525 [Euryarchaeota archaeon]|nr:hypothetical protein [Euryarchaeota archaeon]MDE1836842.1 hypothetical protein [Euryarchaeota archaeon]MDE1879721.1 hypothetical protein [Euryarchaeota archaeon]MDE2046056.1 hypothetical protein [Thermoplasmata archaeon]